MYYTYLLFLIGIHVTSIIYIYIYIKYFARQRYNTPYICNVINIYYMPLLEVVLNH